MEKIRVEISFKRWHGKLPSLEIIKKDVRKGFGVITCSIDESDAYCVMLGKGDVNGNEIKIQPKIIEIMKHRSTVRSLKVRKTSLRVYISFDAVLKPVELIGQTVKGSCYGIPRRKLKVKEGKYSKKIALEIALECLKHHVAAGGFIERLGKSYDLFPSKITYKYH